MGTQPPAGRWCLSLRAGPPTASSGVSDGLYLAAGRPAQPPPLDRRTLARSWSTEQPLSRSPHRAATFPVRLPCTELTKPGSRSQPAPAPRAPPASPWPAGITHLPQASRREGLSRATTPG